MKVICGKSRARLATDQRWCARVAVLLASMDHDRHSQCRDGFQHWIHERAVGEGIAACAVGGGVDGVQLDSVKATIAHPVVHLVDGRLAARRLGAHKAVDAVRIFGNGLGDALVVGGKVVGSAHAGRRAECPVHAAPVHVGDHIFALHRGGHALGFPDGIPPQITVRVEYHGRISEFTW